ncbi:Asp23/Gls24 family envelope stress response protein [Actinocorallia longicatena]
MTDLDHPYSTNGGGGEHRPGLGPSMPFFPAPPASGPGTGAGNGSGTGTPVAGGAPGTAAPGTGSPVQGGVGSPGPVSSAPPVQQPVTPVSQPPVSVLPPAVPISAETGRHHGSEPPAESAGEPGRGATVKGRIKIEDEVVEKIAAMAALEVAGVAGLGTGSGPSSETLDAVRQRIGMGERAERGVQARVTENEIALEITLIVEYGSVVIDVAKIVKTNVARIVGLMLGMKVTSVNVTIDDVKMPG